MKFFQATHTYAHPWSTVTAASHQKYNWKHTVLSHVIAVDILSRSIDENTGRLRTERLITCQQNVPAFITKLIGGDAISYIHEISHVDPNGEEMTAKSRNITGNHLLICEENVRYSVDPSNNQNTLFHQTAEIRAFTAFSRLTNMVEEFCIKRFYENSAAGRRALDDVVEHILREGRELRRELAVAMEEVSEGLNSHINGNSQR